MTALGSLVEPLVKRMAAVSSRREEGNGMGFQVIGGRSAACRLAAEAPGEA